MNGKKLISLMGVCASLLATHLPAYGTPDALKSWCEKRGGTFTRGTGNAGSDYGCVLPDGTTILCPYGNRTNIECTTYPPAKLGDDPQPPEFPSPEWFGLWKTLVVEQEVIETDNKVDTILQGMNFLLDQAGGTAPDLVPLPLANQSGKAAYCRRSHDGVWLQVLVHNQGGTAAAESDTRVEFQTGGGSTYIVALPTSALTGTSPTTLVEFPIPENCTGAGGAGYCDFQISVDIYNDVTESSDENNDAVGSCSPL